MGCEEVVVSGGNEPGGTTDGSRGSRIGGGTGRDKGRRGGIIRELKYETTYNIIIIKGQSIVYL